MSSPIHALFVFGTRPEGIKLAPVIRELRRRRAAFRVSICVTAQHRGLLDRVLRTFRLRPHYDLNIMARGQTLFHITTKTLQRIEPILKSERPDVLFVQGDTTTAFAAALAAFYERVPVAHVEAGLRTYDLEQPYPEELNRRLISPIARFSFAPTAAARRNLLSERIAADSIFITGNTVIDAMLQATASRPDASCVAAATRQADRGRRRAANGKRIILVTAHRRENFGSPLENICQALLQIVRQVADVEIVYPVHPNPRVREPVNRLLAGVERINLVTPLDYVPFARLLKRSYLILSDSGGIQEEAPALGKPVLVLRDKTERPEAVAAGTAQLVGTNTDRIVSAALKLLDSRPAYRKMAGARNPFGDGSASVRIADFLEFAYGRRSAPPREFNAKV